MRPLAFLILLSISISSAGLAYMNGTIDPSGTAHISFIEELPGAAGRLTSLNVTGPSDSVIVKDRSGLTLPARVSEQGNYTIIQAAVPVDYIQFDLTSDSFTDKSGDAWVFDMAIGSSENISAFNSTIQLPKGSVVRSTNGAVGQDGDVLNIGWSGSALDPSRRLHLKAGYDMVPEAQASDQTPLLLAGGALLVIVLAYLLKRPKASPAMPPPHPAEAPATPALESNAVFKTLDETDKEIIREIAAQNGKTTQAHIYMRTHVPKATLSRRLASLENRGIIRKSQKGNRNLVSLTELMLK